MNHDDLIATAKRDLRELLCGEANDRPPPRRRYGLAGYDHPTSVWLSIPDDPPTEVFVTREAQIEPWERSVLDGYARALQALCKVPDEFAAVASDDILLRVVARQHSGGAAVVERAMRFAVSAAGDTYEGKRISQNLLIDLKDNRSGVISSLDHFKAQAWWSSFGSGTTSGILLNRSGEIVQVVDLQAYKPLKDPVDDGFYPDRFREIAQWTNDGGTDRIALSLTRSGEVWIHSQGFSTYVHRAGQWKVLPSENLENARWCAGAALPRSLKAAVAASVLDASLAHHGACIAVVVRKAATSFEKSGVVRSEDRWPQDLRSRLPGTTNFIKMSRQQRLELLSMDGATVIDRRGDVLAAGAIVYVDAGSSGGGRLAAAQSLARYGCAFKVSEDGPVTLFARNDSSFEMRLLFG